MFSTAKAGDRVWDFVLGWGTVQEVIPHCSPFPVVVLMDNRIKESYTYEGSRSLDSVTTLFWGELEYEIPKKPLPDIPRNTMVTVWDHPSHIPVKAHLFGFNHEGDALVYPNGQSEWTYDGTTDLVPFVYCNAINEQLIETRTENTSPFFVADDDIPF